VKDVEWAKTQAILYNVGHSSNTRTYKIVLVWFMFARYNRFLLSQISNSVFHNQTERGLRGSLRLSIGPNVKGVALFLTNASFQ